jgi:DNA-binding PadR family transcriptional regulator
MEMNPTSYVILGMLGLQPMCGYEIKSLVDRSTRFFWAASYGQIYPELRRLSEAGLIDAKSDPGHSRKRTEFSLTPAGRAELERWLAGPSRAQEMRDENLLKLFFSDAGGPDAGPAALDAKAAHHRAEAAELREIEAASGGHEEMRPGPATTLRFGIAFNEFIADWCEGEAREQRR